MILGGTSCRGGDHAGLPKHRLLRDGIKSAELCIKLIKFTSVGYQLGLDLCRELLHPLCPFGLTLSSRKPPQWKSLSVFERSRRMDARLPGFPEIVIPHALTAAGDSLIAMLLFSRHAQLPRHSWILNHEKFFQFSPIHVIDTP